jgi:putative protease
MEVLAPAGSIESLKAAILGGADAVYLGGSRFGARRFAQNFKDEELAGAVDLAHSKGVKVYVTVNILVKERELEDAVSYVGFLEDTGTDAVIVQDRGLLRAINERMEIPVHASTQMGIHTPEGAKWAEESGIDRVILARELSLAEISKIRDSSKVGLEVFVHGALCYCFSGQCLFSSFAGGRSGNRGTCAQPCRKFYRLGENQGYLLSTSDMFCIDAVPDLMRMGIQGLKIEGRMRSPVYTYLATKVYAGAVRKVEGGETDLVSDRDRELLEVAFNRGFSRGYMMEPEVMQREYPDSRGLPLGEFDSGSGSITPFPKGLSKGDGLTLYKGLEKMGGFEVTAKMIRDGELRCPFHLKDGRYSVHKTRDHEFRSIEASLDQLVLRPRQVTRSSISLRRLSVPRGPKHAELSAMVSSLKVLERIIPFVDRAYFELAPRMEEAEELCHSQEVEFIPLLPRVTPQIPEVMQESLMVCSVDQARKYQGRKLYGHYSMNVFNGMTIPEMHQCMSSIELSREEVRDLLDHYPGRLEVMVFGRIELMVTKDPSIAQGVLRDPAGHCFPVYRDGHGMAHILNSADLMLLEFVHELEEMGVDSLALDLRRKNPDLAEMVARAFKERDMSKKSAIKRRCGAITTGHYLKGVE